jgi:hypothetical protein
MVTVFSQKCVSRTPSVVPGQNQDVNSNDKAGDCNRERQEQAVVRHYIGAKCLKQCLKTALLSGCKFLDYMRLVVNFKRLS